VLALLLAVALGLLLVVVGVVIAAGVL